MGTRSRPTLSGRQLQRIVGHYISMSLIRRETMCVCNAIYAFISKYPDVQHKLWPSVRRELRWMECLT
eukprot:249415-Karenia_brevis.AAC.1